MTTPYERRGRDGAWRLFDLPSFVIAQDCAAGDGPDLGYGDLEISDGATASAQFTELEAAGTQGAERERVANALREYCGRDTLATVKILDRLLALARS